MTDRDRIEALECAVAELCERAGIAFGRRRGAAPTGEANGNSKLTAAQVAWARAERAKGRRFTTLAQALGVAESTIRRAVKGQHWGER